MCWHTPILIAESWIANSTNNISISMSASRVLNLDERTKLVGGFNPSEKYDFVSWDDDIPNWMESHKIPVPNISKPPTKQSLCFLIHEAKSEFGDGLHGHLTRIGRQGCAQATAGPPDSWMTSNNKSQRISMDHCSQTTWMVDVLWINVRNKCRVREWLPHGWAR